jgi:hypothetical protein
MASTTDDPHLLEFHCLKQSKVRSEGRIIIVACE